MTKVTEPHISKARLVSCLGCTIRRVELWTIVPAPTGTTQLPHMIDNIGATQIRFTSVELAELDRAVAAIEVKGKRLPDLVQSWSDVEVPQRG